MLSRYGFVLLGLLCLHAPVIFGQVASSDIPNQSCDESCQRVKLDALFKAMEEADVQGRPKPSDSKECAAHDGRDRADTLIDVCAKLKYVRSLKVGADIRFGCPAGASSLKGLPRSRILSAWGEPDFVHGNVRADSALERAHWTYFIGSPKPLTQGGGFPELSLYFTDDVVSDVRCDLSR